jgi:thiamine kinase-like enzyme
MVSSFDKNSYQSAGALPPFFLEVEESFSKVSDGDEQRLIEESLSKTKLTVEQVRTYVAQYVKPEQVEPILEAFQKLFSSNIQSLTLLTNGRGTSKIFKLTADDKDYICRVTDSTRPAFFIDTDSEILNMKLVNDLEVAPKMVHDDAKSGVIIMECVNNMPLTTKMIDDKVEGPTIYKALSKSLANLHKGPSFPGETLNIFRDIEVRVKEADKSRMPEVALKVMNTAMSSESILKKHETTAPCHRDLHSNNVLYDGKRIYLIDWELGCNSDPYSDLGFASMFFVFDAEKEDIFLENYFGKKPTPEQKAYYFLMKQVCICCYASRLMRRVCGFGKMDLSKEQVDLAKLQN